MKKIADKADDSSSAPRRVLLAGLEELGIGDEACPLLMRYLFELQKWNSAYNLTAVRDPVDMVVRHLLDSIAAIKQMSSLSLSRVLDVGSGAGLPGIPLAILNPQLSVSLLDSNGKKARFLRHVVRTLELPDVEVIESRVETFNPAQKFDGVTARAFADIEKFVSLTRHLVLWSGYWLAMTGRLDNNVAMSPTLSVLSDPAVKPVRLHVPGLSEEERHLVIIPFGGAKNS